MAVSFLHDIILIHSSELRTYPEKLDQDIYDFLNDYFELHSSIFYVEKETPGGIKNKRLDLYFQKNKQNAHICIGLQKKSVNHWFLL